MTEYRFEVSAEEVGCRLDAFLARRFPLLSQTKLRSLIASGAATFAGNTLSIGRRLKPDDAIEFRFDWARTPCCYPEGIPLEVLREDPCFVVVNKPAGMLVHPTKGVKRGTLTNRGLDTDVEVFLDECKHDAERQTHEHADHQIDERFGAGRR